MAKVGTKHRDYVKRLPQWVRQRDVIEGEDQVKSKEDLYLPRLDGQPAGNNAWPGQDQNNVVVPYRAYLSRAQFMNATGRTRDGLVGAIMRKEPDVTWPEGQEDFLKHIGRHFESLNEVIHETLDENVGVGRLGHLVDMPAVGNEPYVATYYAEDITNWESALVDGREIPVRVDLCEKVQGTNAVGQPTTKHRYRILILGTPAAVTKKEQESSEYFYGEQLRVTPEEVNRGAFYFQEIWDEVESEANVQEYVRTAVIVPRVRGGALMTEIPFIFYNPTDCKARPQKPAMLDLAVVNLSHYRNGADLEHGLHFTALPQPWAAGFKFKGDVFIGSGVAWVSDEPRARAGYLEFSGQGLKAISDRMEEKKKEMATLGARLLEEQQAAGAAEAMETVQLRQSGERSVLTRISLATSYGLSKMLRYMAMFMGMVEFDKVAIKLNLDFGVSSLTPEQLTALMEQVQAGYLSWNTYFWNLKRGELIPDGIDEKDEEGRITAGPPQAPPNLIPQPPGGTTSNGAPA